MEKRQTFRLGKAIFFFSAFFAAMVFVFVACRQDAILPSTNDDAAKSAALIENAKKWFEDAESKDLFSTNVHFRMLQPQWHQAFAVKGGIEVPILIDGKLRMPSIKGKTEASKSKERLVLLQKGNAFEAVLVSYMPRKGTESSVKGINIENFLRNKFDGFVSLRSPDKATSRLFDVKDGRIVKKFTLTEITNAGPAQLRCTTEEICTDIYVVTISSNGEVIDITYEGTVCVTVCVDNGDDDGCPNAPWCPGDPCHGPNPPANCGLGGGNGGGSGGGGNSSLCNFTGELWCDYFETLYFGRIDITNNNTYIDLGEMTYSHKINVTNCRAWQYTPVDLTYETDNTVPGTFSSINHNFTKLASEPVQPGCSQCGFRASVLCKANASFMAFAGPWGGFPIPQDLRATAAFFIQ